MKETAYANKHQKRVLKPEEIFGIKKILLRAKKASIDIITGDRVYIQHIESLILAQDERWRRA